MFQINFDPHTDLNCVVHVSTCNCQIIFKGNQPFLILDHE